MPSKRQPSFIQQFIATASLSTMARMLRKGSPFVASILITTRNRATYLDLTLAALERQTFPAHSWEVVVMDNASQDDTPAVLDKYEQTGRLRLVRLRPDRRCRQATLLTDALAAAQGRILLFLAEDRLVHSDFLLQHLLLHLKEDCMVLGEDHRCIHTHLFAPDEPAQAGIAPAPLLTVPDLDDPQKMASLVCPGDNDYGPLFAYFEQQRQPILHPWAYFTTANASVPRAAIERVEGFDEYFSGWGLEDTDLAYRLHRAGLGFRYAPKASTLRQLRPGKAGSQRDLVHNLNHFCCKHPDMNNMEREILKRGRYIAAE